LFSDPVNGNLSGLDMVSNNHHLHEAPGPGKGLGWHLEKEEKPISPAFIKTYHPTP
jgi:hypothetical protein